jgi:hypothetical protein
MGGKTLTTKSRFVITSRRGYVLSGFCPPRLHLHEYYLNDRGEKSWTSMLLWPVKKHMGDATSRSLRQKFALHLIWLPSALLPQVGTIWERVDDNHAVAKLIIDHEPIDITLHIDSQGKLRAAWIVRRIQTDKTVTYSMTVREEKSFGKITIPSLVQISWKDESGNTDKNALLTIKQAVFG